MCMPILAMAQPKTYMPDDIWENDMEIWGYGDGIPNNDSVFTHNIDWMGIIDISNLGVSDLTGIKDFASLHNLDIHGNNISVIELTPAQINQLWAVDCRDNQLTELDFTGADSLWSLRCDDNQLNTLILDSCFALWELSCTNNNLDSLSVFDLPILLAMNCSYNQLTYLDIRCPNPMNINIGSDLNEVTATNNQLNMNGIQFQNNYISFNYLHVDSNLFTGAFDFTGCPNLNELTCSYNAISHFDFTNFTIYSHLMKLICNDNAITSIDFSPYPGVVVWDLNCANNELTYLDSRNPIFNTLPQSTIWNATGNPDLECIMAGDSAWFTANMTVANGSIDPQMYFSDSCTATIYGCTNPAACNFNPIATNNNGSCLFPSTSLDSVQACDSYLWNGNLYTTSTITDAVFTNAVGCDSVATLVLSITPSPIAQIIQNASVLIANANGVAFPFNFVWSTGETTQSIIPLINGEYWVIIEDSLSCIADTVYFTVDFASAIQEHNGTKQLLKITDVLGRESKPTPNVPLFYRYSDGTVEKKLIIE